MYNNGTSHWKDKLIEDQLNAGNFTDYKREEWGLEHFLAAIFFLNQLFLPALEFSCKTAGIIAEGEEARNTNKMKGDGNLLKLQGEMKMNNAPKHSLSCQKSTKFCFDDKKFFWCFFKILT